MDSTQHGDLPRTENDGGNAWKRLRSSQGLACDDGDDDDWSGNRYGIQPISRPTPTVPKSLRYLYSDPAEPGITLEKN